MQSERPLRERAGRRDARPSTSVTRPASSTIRGFTCPSIPDVPERLLAIERALAAVDWLGWERRLAPAAGEAELELIHDPDLVRKIRELAVAGAGRSIPTHSSGNPPTRPRFMPPAGRAR